MLKLRPYQTESIRLLQDGFRRHKRQVLCLPTGAGKTVIFSQMVFMAASKGTSTLVLTHRQELFKQTFASVAAYNIPIQRINPDTKHIDGTALVSVAMVETLERRIRAGKNNLEPGLIIIDEAHFGNFTKIIQHFENSFVIGVTATPVGKHFHQLYTVLVDPISISDLIASKFLCQYKGYQMQDDFSDLKVSRGEYTEESLFLHFDKPELYKGVVEKYKEKCNGQKAIVFNCNIEHSDLTAKAFNDAGIKSYSLTSRTGAAERERILSDFHDGCFMVLNNCGILTNGYDEDTITVVIVNRATASLPLWLQMCGRGSRPNPNKTMFTVLDFGKNHERHGLWNGNRTWKIEKPRERTERAAPTKECPTCAAMLYASVRQCPYCGYMFIAPDKEATVKDGVLVEVVPNTWDGKYIDECTIPELCDIQAKGKLKAAYIWRIVRARGELQRYADLMGYSRGWVWTQQTKFKHDTAYKNILVNSS